MRILTDANVRDLARPPTNNQYQGHVKRPLHFQQTLPWVPTQLLPHASLRQVQK